MEKIENKIESHIHCPNCLSGILDKLGSSRKVEPAFVYYLEIFKCWDCERIFSCREKNDGSYYAKKSSNAELKEIKVRDKAK